MEELLQKELQGKTKKEIINEAVKFHEQNGQLKNELKNLKDQKSNVDDELKKIKADNKSKETLIVQLTEEKRLLGEGVHAKDKDISELKNEIEKIKNSSIEDCKKKEEELNKKLEELDKLVDRRVGELEGFINFELPFIDVLKTCFGEIISHPAIASDPKLQKYARIAQGAMQMADIARNDKIEQIQKD